MADARYMTSYDQSFIETAVKYSVDNGKTWKTQIAIKNSRVSDVSRVMDSTVIVKGKKIYVLVGSYKTSKLNWEQQTDGSDWEPLLVVGEVTKKNMGGSISADITWTKPISLKSILPETIAGGPSKQFIGGVGAAIVTSNGTLVFPVQATNTNGGIVAMIIYSTDDGKTWNFSKGSTDPGCSESAIVEWEDKLIMNSRLNSGYRKVYESTDMGTTWTEALGTLSRVWGNSPTREGFGSESSFIAVTIDGRRVMLFTHPLNFQGGPNRDRLHLWLTDNNRIFDVGQVSVGNERSPYSSLVYANDELFCLHEINHKEVFTLALAHLVDELQLIKSVVRTWIAQDTYLMGICTLANKKVHNAETNINVASDACETPFPTAGLVGLLSDKASDNHWSDVYRCVDANVTNAIKVPRGFQFMGIDGGAQWPVSKQGQNRRYQFSNYVFTLVATVSIDELPTGESAPLLGVSLDESGNEKVLGLSYNRDQKWVPIYGSAKAVVMGSWELNRTYHVALTLEGSKGSLYLNGEPLEGSGNELEFNTDSPDVSHFYIGGYGNGGQDTESLVTVTNVLLYNRQLTVKEIKTLFLNKDRIGVAE